MLDDKETHIPVDLLRDILARLPVKTLLRYRCVCKLWCTLIDSKDFRLNTNNRKNTDVLVMRSVKNRDQFIFTVRSTDTSKITDDLCMICESYTLLGTCNGLMLMLMSKKLSDNTVMLRLWNPSIQKSLILPSCPLSSEYLIRVISIDQYL
ncbi:putative F-box protein At1g50870 [Chenopodium quinoa]|uniref:putative F-box protein At1g50870 n=1 Tax=Chenopodium quinoa TaxID=63459 RepID=UPI000B7985A4|nr:putative F-box protein At1g50870 [Chenopodium quinoa]